MVYLHPGDNIFLTSRQLNLIQCAASPPDYCRGPECGYERQNARYMACHLEAIWSELLRRFRLY